MLENPCYLQNTTKDNHTSIANQLMTFKHSNLQKKKKKPRTMSLPIILTSGNPNTINLEVKLPIKSNLLSIDGVKP